MRICEVGTSPGDLELHETSPSVIDSAGVAAEHALEHLRQQCTASEAWHTMTINSPPYLREAAAQPRARVNGSYM